jgi:DSBA-like thioredoxin domain
MLAVLDKSEPRLQLHSRGCLWQLQSAKCGSLWSEQVTFSRHCQGSMNGIIGVGTLRHGPSTMALPAARPKPLPSDHAFDGKGLLFGEPRMRITPILRGHCVHNELITAKTCIEIALHLGLDVQQFEEAIDSSAIDQRVTTASRCAFERGAFGVPTLFVEIRMFWGNDRLMLLEHSIATRVAARRGFAE